MLFLVNLKQLINKIIPIVTHFFQQHFFHKRQHIRNSIDHVLVFQTLNKVVVPPLMLMRQHKLIIQDILICWSEMVLPTVLIQKNVRYFKSNYSWIKNNQLLFYIPIFTKPILCFLTFLREKENLGCFFNLKICL